MNFISQEVTKFNNWVGTLDAVPTIVEIRKKAENIRKQEIEKTLKKISHLSEDDKKITSPNEQFNGQQNITQTHHKVKTKNPI